MVISGKKPNFGRQDTRDTKSRHIHVTETMRHSTPSAPSTTLRPRWSLNSEHSVFNTLYISWRQNWDFGDKTQFILEKEKILLGTISRGTFPHWDFYFVGEFFGDNISGTKWTSPRWRNYAGSLHGSVCLDGAFLCRLHRTQSSSSSSPSP